MKIHSNIPRYPIKPPQIEPPKEPKKIEPKKIEPQPNKIDVTA